MAQLQGRVVLDVVIGALLDEAAQPRQPVGRDRVRAHEGILLGVRNVLLLRKPLERLDHAPARLMRCLEEF